MSPILVRPVREQLEHDRIIRLLQAKYKRKFEVGINPGNEQSAPVGAGTVTWYPDLVLQSPDRGRKLLGVVEVETAESINHLEAMSQWVAFARLQAAFHLYIPVSSIDVARRLCVDLRIPVAEMWAYHAIGEQMRFTLVERAAPPEEAKPARTAAASPEPASRAATGKRAGAKAGARARSARPVAARAAAANGRRPTATKAKSGTRRSAKVPAGKSTAQGGTKTPKRR